MLTLYTYFVIESKRSFMSFYFVLCKNNDEQHRMLQIVHQDSME